MLDLCIKQEKNICQWSKKNEPNSWYILSIFDK